MQVFSINSLEIEPPDCREENNCFGFRVSSSDNHKSSDSYASVRFSLSAEKRTLIICNYIRLLIESFSTQTVSLPTSQGNIPDHTNL